MTCFTVSYGKNGNIWLKKPLAVRHKVHNVILSSEHLPLMIYSNERLDSGVLYFWYKPGMFHPDDIKANVS